MENKLYQSEYFMEMLKELESETASLSGVLDNASDTIRLLEKSLTESKTNFFFKKSTYIENIFGTDVCWFISWEPCSISKKYRLFLISEEKETNEVTFRKPLIECKLELRLRFSQFIPRFMNSFKEELKEYRISLS